MSVQTLIKSQKEAAQRRLPPEVLADVKAVLKANDANPDRLARVSVAAFLAHCAKVHKYRTGRSALGRKLLAQLGRKWGGK